MSRYPIVALGEVLTPSKDVVTVAEDARYETAGLYSHARGLFRRPAIFGSETNYRQYNLLRSGQIVYSKLFGWEGAVAYVTDEFDGVHVSHEFPTFEVDETKLDPRYVRHFVTWPSFHAALSKEASGMGSRRQRVNPERFLSSHIPLPGLVEQCRIADKLDLLLTAQAKAAVQSPSVGDAQKLMTSGLDKVLGRWAQGFVRVDDVCRMVSDTVHPGADRGKATEFVGLEHIAPHFGERIGSRPLGEEKGRKFRFAPGDILYGYLRPYLNKVWLADQHGLCSVEQYVLRSTGGMPAELIAAGLRSKRILDEVLGATHNLQLPRLRSGLLLAMEIPFIPPAHQAQALADLKEFDEKVRKLARTQQHRDEVLAALRPAILDAAFSGGL